MYKHIQIKKLFSASLTAVSGISYHSCALSPPPTLVSCTLTGPPTRFHLEEQQLRSPGHMTSKGANQQVRSKPNHERVSVACCTQHSFTLLRFRGSLSNVLGTSQRCCSTSVSPLPLAACPFMLPSLSQLVHPLSSPPTPQPSPHAPACVRASWACYPIPTVVAEFVSLTKGPVLYTSQRANDSNKQGPWRRGGQAGRCSVELHWVLGRSTSLETQEPTICFFDVWRRFGFDGNFRKT